MAKTAFLFPGQGSQFTGMGKSLYESSAAAKAVFDEADAAPGLDLRVFVMDNGSSDNTKAVAEAVDPRVRVIRTEDNRWVVGVINRGMEAALPENPDYVLVLNDDTQFLPGALRKLLEVAEAHPNAVLTPMQLAYHKPGKIDPHVLKLLQKTPDLVEDAVARALEAWHSSRLGRVSVTVRDLALAALAKFNMRNCNAFNKSKLVN